MQILARRLRDPKVIISRAQTIRVKRWLGHSPSVFKTKRSKQPRKIEVRRTFKATPKIIPFRKVKVHGTRSVVFSFGLVVRLDLLTFDIDLLLVLFTNLLYFRPQTQHVSLSFMLSTVLFDQLPRTLQ